MKQHAWLEFKRARSRTFVCSPRGFGHPQKGATEIWEDNASKSHDNPTNRDDRSRNVDVKVHFLRDLVPEGHIKLAKCAGTQTVSDTLTKSLKSTSTALSETLGIYGWYPYLSRGFILVL